MPNRAASHPAVRLLETPAARGQVLNVGNHQEVSIGALAEKVRAMTGGRSEIRFVPYDEAYGPSFEDMARRVPDLTKIGRLIGYRPKHSLDEILRDVIESLGQGPMEPRVVL